MCFLTLFPACSSRSANCSESVWSLRANFNKLKLLVQLLFVLNFLHTLLCHSEGDALKTVNAQRGQEVSSFSSCVFYSSASCLYSLDSGVPAGEFRVFVGWTCLKLNFPWSDSRLGNIWQCWFWIRFCFCFLLLPALDTFLLSGVSFEGLRKSPHCAPSGAAATRCSAPISFVLP